MKIKRGIYNKMFAFMCVLWLACIRAYLKVTWFILVTAIQKSPVELYQVSIMCSNKLHAAILSIFFLLWGISFIVNMYTPSASNNERTTDDNARLVCGLTAALQQPANQHSRNHHHFEN